MNIIVKSFSMGQVLNRVWGFIKQTPLERFISHRAQVLPAAYLYTKGDRRYAQAFAESYFGLPLRGAGSAWESRLPLPAEPTATSPIVTTGANGLNFFVPDWCEVLGIRFAWQVAGTVTALVMDFDKYPSPNAVGTVVDKLDGTNGVLTAPTVASQAIGNVLYKDLGDQLAIELEPGNSVRANVTTTTTAGSGVPAVIVVPHPETMLNLSTAVLSS